MKMTVLATLAVALAFPLAAESARPMLAAGHAFTAALHSNGTVYQWGDWNCRSTVNHGVPELIPGLTNVTSIAAGKDHLVALLADGTVVALGNNLQGQLGHGDFVASCTVTPVTGLTGVVAIGSGAFTSYAILANNTLVSWGDGLNGALGATDSDRSTPGPGTNLAGVTGVASGGDSAFALAIKSPGTVWAWGDNTQSQLGFDTGSATFSAVEGQSGALDSVRHISTGNYSSAASRTDGSVYTWGWNSNGELANGVVGGPNRVTPGEVIGVTGILELASGENHVLGVRYDGIVIGWGDGTSGQLGDNGSAPRTSPVVMVGLTNAIQAVGGSLHSNVLTSDGAVWGMGLGFDGAVGDGAFTIRRAPVSVVGPGGVGLLNLGSLNAIVPSLDTDGDGVPDIIEGGESLNIGVKDNDVFLSPRLFAMQQYRDFLGREGDPDGIDGWANLVGAGDMTRTQVIDSFLSSAEFGGFVAPVVRLYFAAFQRVPDYIGLTFNASLVRAGTVSIVQLADFFTQSPEFMSLYGSLDDTQFVTLLYNNVLGRAPDQAGLDGWVAYLQSGYTRGQVLQGFSDSTEFQASSSNEVFVTMMYAGMLHRTPDANGFNGWLDFLDNATYTRDQVIQGFFLSTEYHDRFLP